MGTPRGDQATSQPSGLELPDGLEGAPQAPTAQPAGLGVLGWLRWTWRQLISMRTALVLLFLLALGSIPGSFLPQRGVDPSKVQQYFTKHKVLAPIFDKLSLFDVFAAPWFAAIYLLLFLSLTGCVIPRSWQHLRKARARPPQAPRNLSRLPHSTNWVCDEEPEQMLDAARATLARRHFRVDRGTRSVAAEKGYLRETGNLVFHIALLALLVAIGMGGLFGYKGNVVVTEGNGFANTVASYDKFTPGRVFSGGRLQPFDLHVNKFHANYIAAGDQRGEALNYSATVHYRSQPGVASRRYELRVNHPLKVDGTKVYLLGHGYAPTFQVTDGSGHVAYRDSVPFLTSDQRNYTSDGVVKVPDAKPTQLGFLGVFLPTAMPSSHGLVSAFPAPKNPTVTLLAFKGNLGLDSGTPQSVYQLDTSRMQRIKIPGHTLRPGQTMKLPHGEGAVKFTGYRQWVSLAITYDPGRYPALTCAILAVGGLLCSLLVRRRRIWVRAYRGDHGRTVVEAGGLTRADASGGFAAEFDDLVAAVRGASSDTKER